MFARLPSTFDNHLINIFNRENELVASDTWTASSKETEKEDNENQMIQLLTL
jgi:hypothetical protein